ncbi:MAG TPA: LLM class F420-dependent oxidoreductase [Ktedonobacterales bacterium]|nr:LLM class F420-dependent oxidoreductase [Ktedonobacterales bacterium]
MTRKIRVGMQFHPQHTTVEALLAGVRRAEEIGLDTLWDWDHFFPLFGDKDGPHFEGWTLLTAIAMVTKRAEIGCLVTCNSYRNPALLSNMAKTVDHLSGGRLILGIGAGWNQRDYREYGYDFGTAGSRLDALEQGLRIIKERWAVDMPPPVRNPIPILIGGGGERKTLRLVAQYADIWHSFGDAETHARKSQVLREWCERVGRDPDEIEHAVEVGSGVSEKDLDAYVESGATHLIMAGSVAPEKFFDMEWLVRWRDRRNA